MTEIFEFVIRTLLIGIGATAIADGYALAARRLLGYSGAQLGTGGTLGGASASWSMDS